MIGDESADQIDFENLTESQIQALQEQADAQEFGEDVEEMEIEAEGEEEEDVIDVDNPEDLAKKGLRRI